MDKLELTGCIASLKRRIEWLKDTYPGAFKQFPNSTTMYPRFAWEVRLAAGVRKLEEGIDKIESCVIEAQGVK